MFAVLIGTLVSVLLIIINKNIFWSRVIKKFTDILQKKLAPSMWLRLFMELNYELLINGYI
jgi:hypothetical protein